MRCLSIVKRVGLFAILAGLAQADTTTVVNPTRAAPSVTILPTAYGYAYAGCYNETIYLNGSDSARALPDGKFTASNDMTLEKCLSGCTIGTNGAPMQFAGVEYGRECYCAQYMSPYSKKIDDSYCLFACDGNSSEICGGADALSVYNMGQHLGTSAGSSVRAVDATCAVILSTLAFVLHL